MLRLSITINQYTINSSISEFIKRKLCWILRKDTYLSTSPFFFIKLILLALFILFICSREPGSAPHISRSIEF